jgi:hypothetical protein
MLISQQPPSHSTPCYPTPVTQPILCAVHPTPRQHPCYPPTMSLSKPFNPLYPIITPTLHDHPRTNLEKLGRVKSGGVERGRVRSGVVGFKFSSKCFKIPHHVVRSACNLQVSFCMRRSCVRILVLFYLNRELYYLQFYGRLHYSYACTKTRHNTLKTKIRREYEHEEVIHTLSTLHS